MTACKTNFIGRTKEAGVITCSADDESKTNIDFETVVYVAVRVRKTKAKEKDAKRKSQVLSVYDGVGVTSGGVDNIKVCRRGNSVNDVYYVGDGYFNGKRNSIIRERKHR